MLTAILYILIISVIFGYSITSLIFGLIKLNDELSNFKIEIDENDIWLIDSSIPIFLLFTRDQK